jgi:hypothetical protein
LSVPDIEIGVRKEHVPFELRTPDTPVVKETVHPLDTEAAKKREAILKEWWTEARTSASDNRFEQTIDADFFDGLQWRDDDAEVLRERGQAPLVFNQIQQHIRWILGTERRTRVDFKVHGREKEDAEPAQTKTKLMKFTDDVNHAPFSRSMAFADSTKVGVGWLECGIRSDPTQEPLFDRWESWRNMWNDPLAKEPDNSDSRFLFRSKWVDEDIAITMFPDREAIIKQAAVSHDLFSFSEDDDLGFTGLYHAFTPGSTTIQSGRAMFQDSFHIGIRRRRVRLIECWYRQTEKVELMRTHISPHMSGQLRTQLMRANGMELGKERSPGQNRLLDGGFASVYNAVRMKVRVSIFCNKGMLQDSASPYKHDKFPFTPIYAFRRDRDNQPYGVIRNMRDPQEDLNKRRSKALHILSTKQVIADEDAVEDWDELEEQVARPDGIIKKARGTELEINSDTTLAREHVNLMVQDMQFLEGSSGVTEENRGEVTNAISGSAISLRQTQGSVVTADLFDNLRFAIQIHGEKKLSLIEQYYSEPKVIRITNDKGAEDFQNVNMPMRAEDGSTGVENDISNTKADFIVDTQDFRETVRLAMFESMMNMMGQMDPEVQLQLLDMVIDLSDLPGKDEMVRRIRDMNGQIDPDAPDAEAQRQAANDQKTEQADRDKRDQEADIGTKESRTAKTFSDSSRSEAETMAKAAEIAELIAANPEMAAAMDELFASFKEGGSEVDPNTSGAATPLQPLDTPPPLNGGTPPLQ